MRTPVIAGNWKMYKSAHEASAFINELASLVEESRHREIVVCPPFVALPAVVSAVRGTNIEVGAQDVFWLKDGPFTGEVRTKNWQDGILKVVWLRRFQVSDVNCLCSLPRRSQANIGGIVQLCQGRWERRYLC
jgi:triosephosphate isomerase